MAEYALIGDMRGTAPVANDAAMERLRLERFDADPVFLRLLDAGRGGACMVGVVGGTWKSERRYRDGTNILETTMQGITGSLSVTDFMPVRALDEPGVGAGLLSASKSLVLANVIRGTGRYNFAQGLVGTLQGAGASLSFVVAGSLVQHAGFQAAYAVCGCVALLALALLGFALPETSAGRGDPAPLRTSVGNG